VNKPSLNICSLEDPVECFLENVVQGQISDETGQTYAEYVDYILEQHPNVVLIDKVFDAGMIQDLFHISYGSLVLSSMTAVDTASALVKLLLMSNPQTVVDRVRCITSQRLVRRICEACREKVSLSEAHREKLGLQPEDECYAGKGCERCGGTGFQGFVPLFEIIPMTRDMKQSLIQSPSVQTLRTLMLEKGIVSLRDAGMKKVKQGLATVQDVLKATML
jgi:type IV pilus assembly protein PilB